MAGLDVDRLDNDGQILPATSWPASLLTPSIGSLHQRSLYVLGINMKLVSK